MTAAPAASPPIARLEAMFAANRAAGRKALAPFVTAGDPDADATVAILEAIDKAGASLCELGVPYSEDMLQNAQADFMAQADPDNADTSGLEERYAKINMRNFDAQPEVTEMDALIAYLQMLGTLVDFSTYTPVASR